MRRFLQKFSRRRGQNRSPRGLWSRLTAGRRRLSCCGSSVPHREFSAWPAVRERGAAQPSRRNPGCAASPVSAICGCFTRAIHPGEGGVLFATGLGSPSGGSRGRDRGKGSCGDGIWRVSGYPGVDRIEIIVPADAPLGDRIPGSGRGGGADQLGSSHCGRRPRALKPRRTWDSRSGRAVTTWPIFSAIMSLPNGILRIGTPG